MRNNEKGLAVLESLLILLIICIIGGTGYYVWHSKNQTDKTLDNASAEKISTPKVVSKPDTSANDETASWLQYETPGKEFRLRIPDGWKLAQYNNSPNLIAWDSSDIDYQKGTAATVQQAEGGRDGGSVAFSLDFTTKNDYGISGNKTGIFKTNKGLTVDKYVYTQTTEPDGPGLPKGYSSYQYVISDGPKKVFISHDELATGPSQVDLVEKVVKTVEIE